jgi:hypothetical protein
MTNYQLVARVASSSSRSRAWNVSTDGQKLTCDCPSWTRRTHTATCREVRTAGACDCKGIDGAKPERTCKHIRGIQARVDAAGGLPQVLRLLRSGVTLSDDEGVEAAAQQMRVREQQARVITRAIAGVRRDGPDRVVTAMNGTTMTGSTLRHVGASRLRPDVVYIRADGWTLGAPLRFVEVARRLWASDWIAVSDRLPGGTWSAPRAYNGRPYIAPAPTVQPPTAPPAVPARQARGCLYCGQVTNRPGSVCQRVACVRDRMGTRACEVPNCIHEKAPSRSLCAAHWAAVTSGTTAPPVAAPAAEPAVPDWLGGRRAIILRD